MLQGRFREGYSAIGPGSSGPGGVALLVLTIVSITLGFGQSPRSKTTLPNSRPR